MDSKRFEVPCVNLRYLGCDQSKAFTDNFWTALRTEFLFTVSLSTLIRLWAHTTCKGPYEENVRWVYGSVVARPISLIYYCAKLVDLRTRCSPVIWGQWMPTYHQHQRSIITISWTAEADRLIHTDAFDRQSELLWLPTAIGLIKCRAQCGAHWYVIVCTFLCTWVCMGLCAGRSCLG